MTAQQFNAGLLLFGHTVTLGRKNPENVEVESQRCLVSMFSFATQLNAELTNHKQNKAVQEPETT